MAKYRATVRTEKTTGSKKEVKELQVTHGNMELMLGDIEKFFNHQSGTLAPVEKKEK